MDDCPHCGGRLNWLTESNPMHAVCSSCGRDVLAVVDPAPPKPSVEDSVLVRVAVRWQAAEPSPRELLALKQFVPELRDRPVTDLARQAKGSSEWELGTHPLYFARGLREEAKKCGLQVGWQVAEA